MVFIVGIALISLGCSSQEQSKTEDNPTFSNYSNDKDVNLFDYLEVSNVSIDYDGFTWHTIRGEIKNTYSETIIGYIRVVALDDQSNIVDSKLIGLPADGLESGESFVFDEPVSQKSFSNYKFTKESLMVK